MHFAKLILRLVSVLPVLLLAPLAIADEYHWVQFAPQGLEARAIVRDGAACPEATIDGTTTAMVIRAESGDGYPIRVCSLPIPSGRAAVTIAGKPLPLPPAESEANSADGGFRLPAQGKPRPGLQRPAGMAVPRGRRRRRLHEARPRHPCRRLSLSRIRLPRRQPRLRRVAPWRQLGRLAG